MALELLNLAEYEATLVKIPRKPPAKDHPFRAPINEGERLLKWNEMTSERNSRWLNDWKPPNYTTVLWTKEFYSIDELLEYGYRVDKDSDRWHKEW